MVGSILSNCSAGLFAFTLYFALALPNDTPIPILTGAFFWGLIFFLSTFIIRYLLYFVWHTKDDTQLNLLQVENSLQMSTQSNATSEEMAAVVKEMLKNE